MSSATEIMQREMERANHFKSITDPYNLRNQFSVLNTSSSSLNYLQSDSYRFMQESMKAQELLRISDYNFGGSLALQVGSATQRAMEAVNLQNMVKDSIALHKLNQPDFFGDIQRQIGSSLSSSLQTVMDNIKTSISVTAAVAMKRFDELQSLSIPQDIAQQTASSLLGLNSIQESIGIRMSAVQQAMQTFNQSKIFADTEAITKVFNQMQLSGVLEKSLSVLNTDHLFAQAIESFNSVSYLTDFSHGISDFELAESISLIENADETDFLDTFKKLNPRIQAYLLKFFLYILLPLAISISANLMMPSVYKAIESIKMTIDQVRNKKKMPLPADIDTSSLRFITKTGQKLRANSNTRSEVLDELKNGQIFRVIQTKKGWVEIEYPCADDEVCSGWVLSTYTEKFKYRSKN